jgi:translation initiation factor 2B subunit (eIF-2B alpha/beta/delta family)
MRPSLPTPDPHEPEGESFVTALERHAVFYGATDATEVFLESLQRSLRQHRFPTGRAVQASLSATVYSIVRSRTALIPLHNLATVLVSCLTPPATDEPPARLLAQVGEALHTVDTALIASRAALAAKAGQALAGYDRWLTYGIGMHVFRAAAARVQHADRRLELTIVVREDQYRQVKERAIHWFKSNSPRVTVYFVPLAEVPAQLESHTALILGTAGVGTDGGCLGMTDTGHLAALVRATRSPVYIVADPLKCAPEPLATFASPGIEVVDSGHLTGYLTPGGLVPPDAVYRVLRAALHPIQPTPLAALEQGLASGAGPT